LYTNTAVLKRIRCRIGNQCSWRSIGVTCWDLLAPVMRRAALMFHWLIWN